MSLRNEYLISPSSEHDGTKHVSVLREEIFESGLRAVWEIARMSAVDMRPTTIPEGLHLPSTEEVAIFGKQTGTDWQPDSAEVRGPMQLVDIEREITHFVVSALTAGRSPSFMWTPNATDDEIYHFDLARNAVQAMMNSDASDDSSSDADLQTGLYL